MHPFDWLLFRRVALAAALAAAVAAGIVVTTDEASSTAAMRLARLSALSPLIAAVSALSVAAHARSRGELRALECLGASPWRAARGAAVGAGLAGAVGITLLVSPWADSASLFPVVHTGVDWILDGPRQVAVAGGVRVALDGQIVLAAGAAGIPALRVAHAAGAALPCLLPLTALVPPWAVTPMRPWMRGASVATAGMLALVGLHLVAAGRFAPLATVSASLPLLAATWWGRASRQPA